MKNTMNHSATPDKSSTQQTPGKSQQKPPEGTPWQFYFVILVMVLGFLGLIAKTVFGF
jgi:hypothetical protein